MTSTYKHRYRIDEDYFGAMCAARGWLVHVIYGTWYVCELPPGVRSAVKMGRGRYRIIDFCIGIYGPKVSRCFHTNRVPKKTDPRVIPWCDCCWVRP